MRVTPIHWRGLLRLFAAVALSALAFPCALTHADEPANRFARIGGFSSAPTPGRRLSCSPIPMTPVGNSACCGSPAATQTA
jgi:hypothetical protein